MKRAALAFVVALVPLLVSAEPGTVLLYGKVFTNDKARPWAEAIAIEGTRIVAVGTSEEIAKLAGPKTEVIDLGRRLVIPGINDAHTHPGFALQAFGIDLGFDPSWAHIASAIANAADETHRDVWINATIGPTILLDNTITNETLDKIAPGRKVRLAAFTGHGMILSSAAMKELGMAVDARDSDGGWFGRAANGRVDGRSFEYAQFLLESKLAEMATDDDLVADYRSYAENALRYGITSIQAMPGINEKRFADIVSKANVPLRVRIIRFWGDGPGFEAVKFIIDGTPLERNAALRTAKYTGGGQGRLNFRDITPMVRAAADAKQQILLHAAGDRAVEAALNAFAQFPSLQRPRIEHGDGMQRDLFPLAKKTGAIVVQNPTHFPFRDAFPAGEYMLFRSILDAGIPIAIGSDGPLNPYLNVLLATHRPDNPAEALTREQAVAAYTSGSAYAEMKEREKGTIAPGMLADLAVLSQDIFEVPPPALPDTVSVMTMVDGKIVHRTP